MYKIDLLLRYYMLAKKQWLFYFRYSTYTAKFGYIFNDSTADRSQHELDLEK